MHHHSYRLMIEGSIDTRGLRSRRLSRQGERLGRGSPSGHPMFLRGDILWQRDGGGDRQNRVK
jgi:hypothetical protein